MDSKRLIKMRTRYDPRKIEELMKFYSQIRQLWEEGKLEGKIDTMISKKAQELGFSRSTAWNKIKQQYRGDH
jgi:flagellin-specific chaperone FliS